MGDATAPPRGKEIRATSVQCSMLRPTDYTIWAIRIKVMLRIHKVWETIDLGATNAEKNDLATSFLYQLFPRI